MKSPSISGATKAWKREDRLERWSGNISKHSGRFVFSLTPHTVTISVIFCPHFERTVRTVGTGNILH
jgi:hypothetical protein